MEEKDAGHMKLKTKKTILLHLQYFLTTTFSLLVALNVENSPVQFFGVTGQKTFHHIATEV